MHSYFSLFGICFDQACKDQQRAQADLATAQAAALAALNNPINSPKLTTFVGYGLGAAALLLLTVIIIKKVV